MRVEPIHASGTAHQIFGDAPGLRRAGGELRRDAEHARLERGHAKHLVDQAKVDRALRGETRVEQYQLHRAMEPEEPRQHERRTFRAGQAGLAVGPLERGPLGGVDEIAAHRQAESTGRGHAVHCGDERFWRAPDLGDRAVQVFEDLFESFTRPRRRRPRVRRQIGKVVALASGPDVLEIGAAAENAGTSPQDDHARLVVAGHREAGLAQVLRHRHIEGVVMLGSIEGDVPDTGVDARVNVCAHVSKSAATARLPARSPGAARSRYPG